MSDQEPLVVDPLELREIVQDPALECLPDGPAKDFLSSLAPFVDRVDESTFQLVVRRYAQ